MVGKLLFSSLREVTTTTARQVTHKTFLSLTLVRHFGHAITPPVSEDRDILLNGKGEREVLRNCFGTLSVCWTAQHRDPACPVRSDSYERSA